MRRLLTMLLAVCVLAVLAGCGNKGPLYRPSAKPATAGKTAVPVPAASTPASPSSS